MTRIQWPVVSRAKVRRSFGDDLPLCAASLLSFEDGQIDWAGYDSILDRIINAHLVAMKIAAKLFRGKKLKVVKPVRPVITADTSFTFNLLPEQRMEVIRHSLNRFKNQNVRWIIGITNTGAHADEQTPDHCLELMRQITEEFPEEDITFMIMQWRGMTKLKSQALVNLFKAFSGYKILLHELVEEFVAHGRLLTAEEFAGIAALDHVTECKVSALGGGFHIEQRVELVRELGLSLKVYSGNDWDLLGAYLAADGLLMGLITSFPALFVLLSMIDPDNAETGWMFNDLCNFLSFVGKFLFRVNPDIMGADVAAYKSNLAQLLFVLRVIATFEIHPGCPAKDQRPESDIDVLRSMVAEIRHTLKVNFRLTEDDIDDLLK